MEYFDIGNIYASDKNDLIWITRYLQTVIINNY